MTRKESGFSLLETLIAVIVLTALAGTFASMLLLKNKQEAKTDYREIETRELSQIYYAVKAYMKENASAVTATTQQLGLNTLITAGKLPSGFATRGGVLGRTPWRQDYVIYMRLDPTDSKPRAVVQEGTAVPDSANLARAGIPNTPTSVTALKADIATKVTSTYKIPAATIAAGSSTAVGSLNAFTKNLAGLLPAAVAQNAAAVLIGFPDLEPPDVIATTHSRWGNCTFAQPTTSTVWATYGQPLAAQCPAGTQNLVHVSVGSTTYEGFPYCRMNHHWGETNYTIYPTDIGDLTISPVTDSQPVSILMSFYNYGCHTNPTTGVVTGCQSSPQYQPYTSTFRSERVMLNGAEVYQTSTCIADTFTQASQINPPTNTQGCGTPTNSVAPSPPDGVGCAHEGLTKDPYTGIWYDNLMQPHAGLGQNARVLLCCQDLGP